jgi:hypothetical protein
MLMDKKTLRDFLLPTQNQTFWCLLLAALSILMVYRNVLLQRLLGSQAVSLGQVGDTFKAQLATLNQVQFVQTGVIVAFWAIVGLCTFAIYAAIRNSGSTVMDEVAINRDYTNTSLTAKQFNWVGIRIGAAIGLLIALQVMWRVGFPLWFGLIEQFILGSLSLGGIVSGIIGFLGLAVSYYALWLLLHTAIIADRL